MGRSGRLSLVGVGVLAGLWCLATLVYVLLFCLVHGLSFVGPYSAVFPWDQLRYLAWIREAGDHLLIGDPYHLDAAHLYLNPLFLVSGLLWRAGLDLQAAYLIWTPVALGVLIRGYARFTGRFLTGGARAAALALALLFLSPLAPLLDWGGIVDANGANYLVIVAGHSATYWQAWGYLPTALAMGLMALFLIRLDEGLKAPRLHTRFVVGTSLLGGLAAWLDPWLGIELAAVGAIMLGLNGRAAPARRLALLALPVLAALLPLVYYAWLADRDSAWSLSQLRSASIGPEWWTLLAAIGPLALVAVGGLRRNINKGDEILLLWPLVALVTYVTLGADARGPALEGITLPLSVLAVRAWRQLSISPLISLLVLLLAIIPGAAYSAATFRDDLNDHIVPFGLHPGEREALHALSQHRGEVLSTPYLASALPALAGIIPAQASYSAAAERFFNLGHGGRAGIPDLSLRGISVVLSDCLLDRSNLAALLHPFGFRTHRYRCATLYTR